MRSSERFDHFASAIRQLDLARISRPADIPATFDLGREGRLSIHYVPFDYVNPAARLVLVGITPGFTQWKNAMREAQRQLIADISPSQVDLAAVKRTGALSGTLRPNLIALLDHIGLNHWLGLASCDALFGNASHLVHTGAILHHPVFVDGRNYNGTPDMVNTPFLKRQIEAHFAPEAGSLGSAMFVPLGSQVSRGMLWLAERGVIERSRILVGLPHPSGANIERIAYFLGRKRRDTLSGKTNADQIDAARHALRAQVRRLGHADG
jgi:hypothetical protein